MKKISEIYLDTKQWSRSKRRENYVSYLIRMHTKLIMKG